MMQILTKYSWVVAGLGGGLMLSSAALYFIYRDTSPFSLGCLGLGAVLGVLWVWLDARAVKHPGQREAVAFGLTSMLIVMMGLGLVLVLQSLAVRFDTRWDLTADRRFTLSEHSQSVLAGLKKEVTIYAIFRKGSLEGERFLRMATSASGLSEKVTVISIDPLFDVALLRQVVKHDNERERGRMSEYGTVIMVTDSARQRFDGEFSETTFVNALIRLESKERHQVCWSVGHGERSFEDMIHPAEMGLLVSRMHDQNYTVKEVRVATGGLNQGCDLLVVAGPQTDWLVSEREALLGYIAYGGKALILLDPEIQGAHIDDFVADLEVFGLATGQDFVMEASRQHLEVNTENEPLQFYYGSNFTLHPIVDVADGLWAIQFARSVAWQGTEGGGLTGRTLIEASEMSWAEEEFELSGDSPPSPDTDEKRGRIGLAALVEVTEPRKLVEAAPEEARGRLVVFGDSDFASNQLSSLSRNSDIFLNAVAWLVGEDHQLGDRPLGEAEFFVLTGVQMSVAMLVSLVVGPGLCLGLGLWVFVRRKTG